MCQAHETLGRRRRRVLRRDLGCGTCRKSLHSTCWRVLSGLCCRCCCCGSQCRCTVANFRMDLWTTTSNPHFTPRQVFKYAWTPFWKPVMCPASRVRATGCGLGCTHGVYLIAQISFQRRHTHKTKKRLSGQNLSAWHEHARLNTKNKWMNKMEEWRNME